MAAAAVCAEVAAKRAHRPKKRKTRPNRKTQKTKGLQSKVRQQTYRIDANPDSAEEWLIRGFAYCDLGEFSHAVEDMEKALSTAKTTEERRLAFYGLTVSYAEAGRFKDCVSAASEFLAFEITSAVVRSTAFEFESAENVRIVVLGCRARAYNHLEMFEECLLDCEEMLELGDTSAHPYQNRGTALMGLYRYEEALSSFGKARNIDSNCAHTLLGMANIRATCPIDSIRNGPEAVSLAEKACQLFNNHWATLSVLAGAWAECGHFDKAIQFAEQALEAAPEDEKQRRRERISQYRAGITFRRERHT